jgi:hypothetical protein
VGPVRRHEATRELTTPSPWLLFIFVVIFPRKNGQG